MVSPTSPSGICLHCQGISIPNSPKPPPMLGMPFPSPQVIKPMELEKIPEKIRLLGFELPPFAQKIWEGFQKFMEKIEFGVFKVVGSGVKYFGLFLLIAGAIHLIVMLSITSLPVAALTGGLTTAIFGFIKSGAFPTLISGAAIYKFGYDLKSFGENPDYKDFSFFLAILLLILPLPFGGLMLKLVK